MILCCGMNWLEEEGRKLVYRIDCRSATFEGICKSSASGKACVLPLRLFIAVLPRGVSQTSTGSFPKYSVAKRRSASQLLSRPVAPTSAT